jgi:hypothetical protein
VTLKVVPKAAFDESEGKPEQKYDELLEQTVKYVLK